MRLFVAVSWRQLGLITLVSLVLMGCKTGGRKNASVDQLPAFAQSLSNSSPDADQAEIEILIRYVQLFRQGQSIHADTSNYTRHPADDGLIDTKWQPSSLDLGK